ncbi:MAG TPA: UvrD-helicase domain-containing protein, partial [Methanocorpusculum sp.]|nr:UvrD-helicase domain-containing protein [Methanocorpusculum sp.]
MDSLAERELVANTIEDTLEHPGDDLREYAVCLYSAFSANEVPKLIFGLLGKLQVCPTWFKKLETETGRKKIHAEWEKEKAAIPEMVKAEILTDPVIQEFIKVSKQGGGPKGINKDAFDLFHQLKEETELNIDTLSAFCARGISNKSGNVVSEKLVDLYNSRCSNQSSKKGRYLKSLESSLQHYEYDDPHTQLMLSVMQALYKITAAVAEKVEAKKAAAGYLNFDDLISSAKALLKDEKICAVLAKRYEYVLVDEVQDNDSSLTEIINNLAGSNEDNLFIVGDMKQSIYRFRGADPESVQNKLFRKFPDEGKVTLDTNFRTVQRLIDAVNILFTRLYPEGNEEHIPYEPVKAHRNCCPEDAGTLTILRAHKEKGDGNKSTAPKEAALLSRWIGKKVAEKDLLVEDESGWHPAEYRDFAVLVRKNTDGGKVKKAFDAFGIPYHDCSGDKMYTSDEIRDLISVIRAAVCHEEDTALYAALKSPYFGITDAELAFAAYDENKYPQNLWRRLESFAAGRKTKQVNEGEDTDAFLRFAADAKKHLTSALSALELFARAAVSDTLPHLIRLIFETTGIISVYAALPNGTDRISNLRQFLAVSDHISAERGVSVYEFLRIIDTCVENKIDNEYSSEGETSKENRVQIMTYHVSKGLEFPAVALFRTGTKYNDHINKLMADDFYGAGHSELKYPGESESLFK